MYSSGPTNLTDTTIISFYRYPNRRHMEPFLRHLKCVISFTPSYGFLCSLNFDDKIAAHRDDVQWKMALTLHLGYF